MSRSDVRKYVVWCFAGGLVALGAGFHGFSVHAQTSYQYENGSDRLASVCQPIEGQQRGEFGVAGQLTNNSSTDWANYVCSMASEVQARIRECVTGPCSPNFRRSWVYIEFGARDYSASAGVECQAFIVDYDDAGAYTWTGWTSSSIGGTGVTKVSGYHLFPQSGQIGPMGLHCRLPPETTIGKSRMYTVRTDYGVCGSTLPAVCL